MDIIGISQCILKNQPLKFGCSTFETESLAELSQSMKEIVKTEVTRGESSILLERDHSTWNLSPKETLQTERFYIIWSMFFCIGYSLDVYVVLFKPYGQTFISDDHFLSFVASFASVSSGAGNIGWGLLADRFTYRPVLLMLVSTFAVLLSTLNLTEHGGRAMFLVWVLAMHFSFSGVYVVLPLIVMEMFGSSHYGVNYGLVHSAGIPFSFLSAFVTSELKDSIGWDGIFLIAAAMAVLSFFLAIVIHAKRWPPPTSSQGA